MDGGEKACSVFGVTDGDGDDFFWKKSALFLVFVEVVLFLGRAGEEGDRRREQAWLRQTGKYEPAGYARVWPEHLWR